MAVDAFRTLTPTSTQIGIVFTGGGTYWIGTLAMNEEPAPPFVHKSLLGTPVEQVDAYFPNLDDLAQLRRQAVEDPSGILRIRAVRQGMDYWENVLLSAVRLAREQGNSWTEIADALGITRQAAWKRFASPSRESR